MTLAKVLERGLEQGLERELPELVAGRRWELVAQHMWRLMSGPVVEVGHIEVGCSQAWVQEVRAQNTQEALARSTQAVEEQSTLEAQEPCSLVPLEMMAWNKMRACRLEGWKELEQSDRAQPKRSW